MTVREYIGARYVPLFMGEWDNTSAYEPLSIVQYQGNSYTSRQYVPTGIDITNTAYWAITGNYNAQVEQYRQDVLSFNGRITTNENDIDANERAITTEKGRIDGLVEDTQQLSDRITTNSEDIDTNERAIATEKSRIDTLVEGLKVRQSQFDVAPILLGCVNYSKQNNMYDHPGCICSYGDTQYLYSSPQDESSNAGHSRSISIINNLDNFNTYQTLNIGHANSAAYDTNNNMIYLAPVYDYTGGNKTAANYICKFSPNSTNVTNITTPEWCMAVSFDSVAKKLYVLAYGSNNIGTIYELDEQTDSFTPVKTIERNYEYNQDFAIHNGKFCISSPSGYVFIGTLDTDEQTIVKITHIDSSHMFIYGELDGMEFDANGHLLAVAHSDQLDDRPTYIYELPIFDDVKPYYEYMMKNVWSVGANYTLHINQNNTTLRTDGYSATKGLKSINMLNLLADTTQRSVILAADYICENFRLGNDSYNWISLNNHTLRITGTCTIQTPVIINGAGTFRIANAIAISFGIARIGLAGNIDLIVDNGNNLIATYPVGTFITIGALNSISPSGLKLYSAAQEVIASNQVYILGSEILNS